MIADILVSAPDVDADDALTISFEGQSFHTGYSRIQKYLLCPRQYKLHYVDRILKPSSTPMLRGSAYHDTLEMALRFKIDKGRPMRMAKVLEMAQYFAEQEGCTEGVVTQVINAVQLWYETLYGLINPLFVEESFKIVRGGVEFTGRVDLGTVEGCCDDHKLSMSVWPVSKAKESVQAIIYQWAWEDVFQAKYGVPYKRFEYHVVRSFPGLNLQVLQLGKLQKQQSLWWEGTLREVAEAMCKGIYYPRPSVAACNLCSYKKTCLPPFCRVTEKKFGEAEIDENDYEYVDGKL